MEFSGYCFYINTNIYGDFQICISVPLPVFQIQMFGIFRHFLLALHAPIFLSPFNHNPEHGILTDWGRVYLILNWINFIEMFLGREPSLKLFSKLCFPKVVIPFRVTYIEMIPLKVSNHYQGLLALCHRWFSSY